MNLTIWKPAIAGAILIAALMAPRWAAAQIVHDTTHWNDEELYQEAGTPSTSFFSVGGGILGAYFIPDFTAFNANIANNVKDVNGPFIGKNYRNEVWMIGGQGFVTVPWVKNLRLGGMGYGGTSVDCGCTTTAINDGADTVNRYLTYSVGYGALTIDYVLPLRTGHFHIVPGIALGYGAVNIFARQAQNRLQFDLGADFNENSINYTHTYTSHFFLYMPQLQFEYSPIGLLMFRLTAAYQGTSMGAWTVDQGVLLGNTTALNGIKGNGFVVSLGAFLGLFQ
ncbi:MAG TPA: hypothetical protein VFH95_02430 [Candidatus Kapabacteria bacterium]|nr:hypothetical protein [Candidatus Kapabacteria bacterium]